MPSKATDGSAGWDLFAKITRPIEIYPGEVLIVPTGVQLELPKGWAAWILPRSGLASKFGLTIVNSPGLIDSDYRGELQVILTVVKSIEKSTFGYAKAIEQKGLEIEPYSRIAQLVPFKVDSFDFKLVPTITTTPRGDGGLGSSDA